MKWIIVVNVPESKIQELDTYLAYGIFDTLEEATNYGLTKFQEDVDWYCIKIKEVKK